MPAQQLRGALVYLRARPPPPWLLACCSSAVASFPRPGGPSRLKFEIGDPEGSFLTSPQASGLSAPVPVELLCSMALFHFALSRLHSFTAPEFAESVRGNRSSRELEAAHELDQCGPDHTSTLPTSRFSAPRLPASLLCPAAVNVQRSPFNAATAPKLNTT